MQKRININNFIKEIKKNLIFKNIKSLYIYGSYLTKVSNLNSDIDILIILNRSLELSDLYEIKNIKALFKDKYNVVLELNILNENSISSNKDTYWHNGRGLIFLEEIKKFGKCIYGENVLSKINYSRGDLYLESRKVLLSLIYNLNKNILKIIEGNFDNRDLKRMVKFSCYIVHIMLFIFREDLDFKKINYYKFFDKYFRFNIKAEYFFNLKSKDYSKLEINSFIKNIFYFAKDIEYYILNN